MRSWVQLSLFVAVTALFAVGCGDDDVKIRLGVEGDSCTRTGDCSDGLSCVNNFCSSGGNSGAGGDVDGGSGAGGAPGPALGGEGESCQARRDCQDGLQCIENRCTEGGAAGSGGAPAPRQGSRGESCEATSDCLEGLTCVVRGFGGVCDLEDFGLEPSGNVCTGECEAAADCCELPRNLIPGIRSCEALVASTLANGGLDNQPSQNCPVSGPAPGYEVPCFNYRTYCICGANTWSCDNNMCTYNADCETGFGATWDGCPALTRSGRTPAATICNADERCETTPSCQTAADCGTSVGGATCIGDGCTCFQNTCYLACNEDLDCPFGFACDMGDDVCKPVAACTTDEQCAATTRDATAKCVSGACQIPCSTDQDCGNSGVPGGGNPFNTTVCNANHFCEPLGCTSDDECMSNGVRMFCVEAPAGGAGGATDAITD